MITRITYEEIYPVWENDLWPNRVSKIEPVSIMTFFGGYDGDIFKYEPVFFAYKEDDKILGVNSGFQTSSFAFRSRGLYVDPNARGKGIAKQLLEAVNNYAKENTDCSVIWTIPRKKSLPAYESVGFKKVGPWIDEEVEFGPNCYAYKEL